MSELKKGDLIEIQNSEYKLHIPIGARLFVKNQLSNSIVQLECELHVETKDIKKIEDSKLQYELSNRKALKDFISKQGFHSKEISKAMGFNEVYLSAMSGKSRLLTRGDLSNKELEKVKLDITYAVRKLNGAEAQVVDEPKGFTETEKEAFEKTIDVSSNPEFSNISTWIPCEERKEWNTNVRLNKHRTKSKTEVKKFTVWLVLFIIGLVLFIATGVWKSIF